VPAAVVWEVRDGKVIRVREYMDTWEAMNAFPPVIELIASPAPPVTRYLQDP
jgi:hypothetical protein